MRLTALYVCGTLLVFSRLSWIRAEEEALLDDQGFGPCTATLRPEGACRLGEHGSTCPYLLSLPPLTVHLPHLRELENIMQDLEKLKDSVDELRKMCVDCTESRNDRKCGRQKEREHEKQTEGKSTREDVRNWMNVRLEEAGRDFKLECGNDAIKVKIDRDNSTERRLILEEEERNKWETDRKGSKGAVKENEREETLTEVGEKDGKTNKDSARGTDTLDQKKMPAAGGNTRIVEVTSDVFETDHRDTVMDRIKEDALKGNLKGFQEDKLENEEEKKMLTNVKNKEKTKEESNIYVWQEEINKTKKTEASDKTKMSENHEDHINMEQEEHKGETREEIETGLKVSRNNEKPKQTESFGRTEKKTIKEEEVDDKGIKEKSVQRDGDGELSPRKTTEQPDFFPISPTPLSVMRSTSRPDSSKVTILTSSLPSPSFPSSTLSSITDVSHETTGVYGLTKSSSHETDGIFETQSHQLGSTTATGTTLGGNKQEITSAAAGFTSASTVKPGAGLQAHERSTTPTTTTTHQTLHITESPKVTGHSRWTPKKNISTNIKTILKPPPGRGLKPGQKLKSGIKPEAEQKLKNPKNDRKPNQAPDKKPKFNLKQKPAPHKPAPEKSKPGKDPKQTHISQPDQKPPPYILAPNKNQQNNLTHRQDIAPRNKLPFQKPKSPQKSPTPVQKPTSQRPQTANTTHSDKQPSKDLESAKLPVVDQNLKPDKKIVHPFKTEKSDQKQKPEKTLEREENTKLSEKFERNKNSTPAQNQDPKRPETERFTPKPNQEHPAQWVERSGENPLQEPEPKPDVMPRIKITSDRINSTSDQNQNQEITEMEPKSIQEPESKRKTDRSQPNQRPLTESVKKSDQNILHETESQPDLKPGQKFTPKQVNATSDQLNNSNQDNTEIKPKPIKEPESKQGSAPSDQKPLTESVIKSGKNHLHKPESKPHLTLGPKVRSDRVNATSDQRNNSSQAISKIKPNPNLIKAPKSETASSKPDQKLLAVDKSVENPLHGPKLIPDLTPEQKITADRVHETSDQMNTSSWEITEIKHKPEPVQEPDSKRDTDTPKPNQKHLTDNVETSDENPIQEPESKPDLISRKKTTPESSQEMVEIKHKPKLNQEPIAKKDTTTSKPNEKSLAVDKFIENPLHKPKFNPDLTPGKKMSPDQVSTTSDQTNKPSLVRIKQPNRIQEPESKRETTSQPNHVLLTDSEKKSDKNPFQEPESYPDLQSGLKTTFDQVNATFHQTNKSKQESPKTEHKPKSVQEPESKNESSKPDQKLLTDTVETSDENSLQEHEFNPDIKSGKEMTSDQVNVTSDQTNKSIQVRPTIKHKPKPIQKPESKSKTAPSKPNQKPFTKFADKIPSHEQKRKPDLTPGQKITSDLVNVTSDQINKPRQEIKQKPKPFQEPKSKEGETAPSKPDQKALSESVDKYDKVPPRETEFNPDLTPGQKMTSGQVNITSDQINKPSQKTKQTPKSIQEPESKSETATMKPDQKALSESVDKYDKVPPRETKFNPDSTPGQKITSDLVNVTSDQINKPRQEIKQKPKPFQEPKSKEGETAPSKPDQKSLSESVDKYDKVPPHETKFNPDSTPGQKITSDLVNVTSDQINKPRQEIKQKPKPFQEPKSKEGETAPSKPDQKALSESVDKYDKVPPRETKFNPDSTPGQKMTSGQVNITSDQINKPSQKTKQKTKPTQQPESKSETATLKPDQKALTTDKPGENPLQKPKSDPELISGQTPASNQNPKPGHNIPNINKRPKPGPEPKRNPKYPNTETGLKNKPNTNLKKVHTPQTNSSVKTTRPGPKPNLKPVDLYENIPTTASNRTSKPRPPFRYRPPTRHIIKPGAKPIQTPKSPAQPTSSPKTKILLDPPQTYGASSKNIQRSQTDMPSTSGLTKQIAEVTHTPGETSSTRTRKTLGPKTSNSLKTGHIPRLYTHTEDFTSSPNSRIVSDLRPQTASRPPSIPMATRPITINRGMLQHVITSTSPGSTPPSPVSKSDSIIKTKITYNVEKTTPATPVLSPSLDTTSTPSPDFRSETSTTSGPQPFAAELSTPSARELRVKINQVAAFVNNSLSPNGRPGDGLLKELPKESQRGSRPGSTNGKLPTSLLSMAPRDCSDHLLRGKTKSGVYLVTPDLRSRSFPVFCDMEREGGGWTLLQRRQDGSVSFNRTWVEYQSGFGELDGGEFWLGNNPIHLLTRDRDAVLRVELEDFEGATGFAQYKQFRVGGERLRYRLTVGGYSGTAGDALHYSKRYDHNNRAFTTPDRDHDRYPSGNCGAYYSSGWWFDACMAANLNGRYYFGKYKGVRDGIFWGTWHNISDEYYPTNERQSFKSVRMMIRPKDFVP